MPKAELNAVEETTGDTLLHKYVREERLPIVECLLKAVPRFGLINHVNKCGETALHIACYSGNAVVAERILACPHFINFGALDQAKNTAFHYTCFQNRID